MIANDLAIAVYERDIPTVANEEAHMDFERSISLSYNLKRVIFKTKNESEVFANINKHQKLFGKHFRVVSSLDKTHSRHYTICKSMEPQYYQALCDALEMEQPFNS